MNKQILKNIVQTQMELLHAVPHEIAREKLTTIEPYIDLPHAVVISGVRRCGKSVLLHQIQQAHYPGGVYYFTFEDERLIDFTVQDFNILHEAFIELAGNRQTFFFDEIQNVEQWELFIRRMINQGYKFFLTGSNSHLLSQELATRLTGRNILIELFPYSFREFLKFNQIDHSTKDLLVPEKKANLKKHFNQYLTHGGMPEYLQYKNEEILKRNYEEIISRDIINRYKIKDVAAFRRLSLYLFNNFSSLITYNSLKPLFNINSTTTISNYIHYLENSYLIFTVNQFSYSVKQQNLLPKKLYVIDNGIASCVAMQFSKNHGRYLENCVFLELRRRHEEIYYYQTKKQLEVDFTIIEKGKIKQLIQVSFNIDDEKTRQRELRSLAAAMDETQLKTGLILTDDSHDEIIINDKKIIVKPVYEWMLEY